MDEKISIVVPVFNIAGYVERCLKSILAQTYTNLEIVVVDDGSTDESGDVVDRLAAQEPRIKVIHKENGGVTSARITGIRNASGQWIGFVDGDDEIEPDMFRHLLQNALTYQADISHCGYQMVFPDGRIDYYYNTGDLAKQDKISALKELISGSRIEPGLCNKLFRKTLFHSLLHGDIMPLDIKVNEDYFMNYLLFKEAEQTVYEDFCPYHYILRKGSAATSANRIHITDPIRVNELVKADVQENEQLYPAAYSRYIYALVGAASQSRWKEESHCARVKLKQELHTGSLRSYCSTRLRLMAFGTAYLLPLYRVIRWGYDRITGVSKKYDV